MRIHATAVLLGERAVLLRGPSGSGKSSLALSLLRAPPVRHARLVGDDQLLLEARTGRLLVRPHPNLAGRLELRGFGILTLPFEPVAVVGIVVDRAVTERLPSREHHVALIGGVALPRMCVPPDDPDPVARVREGLRCLESTI